MEEDKRKLIYTKTGFGVKEISKEIGIKRNLKTLVHLAVEANSKKQDNKPKGCGFCEKPCGNPWCPYTEKSDES